MPEDVVVAELKPIAVKIPVALHLLGDLSLSALYKDAARPKDDPRHIEMIKDGERTLVVLASIERRIRAAPAWSQAKSDLSDRLAKAWAAPNPRRSGKRKAARKSV